MSNEAPREAHPTDSADRSQGGPSESRLKDPAGPTGSRLQRLQALFENSLDALLLIDDAGQLVDANPAACELFDRPREELLLSPLESLTAEPERPRISEHWRDFLSNGTREGELVILRKDGGTRDAEFRAVARVLPGLHAAVLRDVTERKRLEAQLRHVSKMESIGRLAGGVSHEFNNVLTIILGYTDLLLDDPRVAESGGRLLAEIKKAGERAATLVRQLLAFSRKQVLRTEVFDLNALIRNLETMLRQMVGDDVELLTDLEERLACVRADPAQFEQVLVNLAANARDAMPTGGRLLIQTHSVGAGGNVPVRDASAESGASVMLVVSDTGIGMDDEARRHLFEPFYTTKPIGKGTGLGLASVYGIVMQSGGRIAVESAPGQGTTVRICLPAAEGSPAPSS